MQRQTDPYLRDRLHDLNDLANRLLHQLAGQSLTLLPSALPENAILVARSMGAAALLDYDRAPGCARLVLPRRPARRAISRSSHARCRFLAVQRHVPNISEIVEHGDAIIVDGVTGEVQLRPQPDVE